MEYSSQNYDLTDIFNQDSLTGLCKFLILLSLNSKFHTKTSSDGERKYVKRKKGKKNTVLLRSYNYLKNILIALCYLQRSKLEISAIFTSKITLKKR